VLTTPPTSCAIPQEAPLHSGIASGNDPIAATSLSTNHIVTPNTSGGNNDRYHVVTRSQNNIFKPNKKFYHTSLSTSENLEPSSIRQAMQHSHWRQAISEELSALIRNGTWSLVPPPVNHNIVD